MTGKFFSNTARPIGYFGPASRNETVSRQNLWAGNIAKSMTSEVNNAMLPANVDRRPPFQRGLTNFQLYNKSLKRKFMVCWSL